MRESQRLPNLGITLYWSEWIDWNSAVGSKIPSEPGVYEAKFKDQEKRLHIGETSKGGLKQRVGDFLGGLNKGSSAHSTGRRIHNHEEDLSNIELRWAVTDCYDAKLAEAWLQRLHRNDFNGSMPTYDKDPCHND